VRNEAHHDEGENSKAAAEQSRISDRPPMLLAITTAMRNPSGRTRSRSHTNILTGATPIVDHGHDR
jgi:hypothetical protein